MASHSFTDSFWLYYGKLFSPKPSFNVIDGEVCHNDILKCFEYSGDSRKYAHAKEDIQAYKGIKAEEYGGYYVTKIIIPKGARVHLGRFYQKNATNIGDATRNTQCRSEEAKIVDSQGKTVTLKPMEFHDQETIRWTDCKGHEHNNDDVTYEAGLRFSLRMGDVNPGTKF